MRSKARIWAPLNRYLSAWALHFETEASSKWTNAGATYSLRSSKSRDRVISQYKPARALSKALLRNSTARGFENGTAKSRRRDNCFPIRSNPSA